MKWFKHHSDSSGNLKLKKIKRNFGMIGYGFYWELLELVAEQGENFKVSAKKDWISEICERTFLKKKKVLELLDAIAEEGLIDQKALSEGDLYVPKMEEHQDDYSRKVSTKSVQDTNKVPLEQEEKKTEKKEKKPHQSLSFLEKVPQEEINKLTSRFVISEKEVQSEAESALNWIKANGKKKSDYRAFLLNWIKGSKKGYREKTPEEEERAARIKQTQEAKDLPVSPFSQGLVAKFKP